MADKSHVQRPVHRRLFYPSYKANAAARGFTITPTVQSSMARGRLASATAVGCTSVLRGRRHEGGMESRSEDEFSEGRSGGGERQIEAKWVGWRVPGAAFRGSQMVR